MPQLFINKSVSFGTPYMRGSNCFMPRGGGMPPSIFGYGFGGCDAPPHCCCGNDKALAEGLLWGTLGVVSLAFAKPIGKALGWVGKGIGKAASWTWNNVLKPVGKGIGKAASWTWNKVLKPAGKAIGKAASWVWNGITGIFKKKNKNTSET